MTDFRIGDRVSVEGVIHEFYAPNIATLQFPSSGGVAVHVNSLTLVERPKRKLRVGSVWEMPDIGGVGKYHAISGDLFAFVGRRHREFVRRDETTFDTHPELWREVPVEELEAEARA